MNKRYFEDFVVGEVMSLPGRPISRSEIIAFAAEYDPQPMHLDEEVARASMLGGLAASGWHTCCLMMRIISDGLMSRSHFLGAPGVDEVRWLAPLRPDEHVDVRANIVDTRASRSRPGVGKLPWTSSWMNALVAVRSYGCSCK